MKKEPLNKEGVVSIVSLFGYWHLHRVVNGKHYFGHSDHRIGLSIRTETPDKVDDWTPREPKILREYTDRQGERQSFTDEPYTSTQIKSFGELSYEALEKWVARGN